MTNLHLADHFPIPLGLSACSGTRGGQPCTAACLAHYSSWSSAPDDNQILMSLPLLPTVHRVFGGETVDRDSDPLEFSLYETGSDFLNDEFGPEQVYALVVVDREDWHVTICLLPSVSTAVAELGRILERFRATCG